MLCQLLVRFVENDLILLVLLHAGFQVVALDDPCDTAEVFVGIHMGSGPTLLVHGEKGLHIAVATVGQGCHEHIGLSLIHISVSALVDILHFGFYKCQQPFRQYPKSDYSDLFSPCL